MTGEQWITIGVELLKDAPELIQEVEHLITVFKGGGQAPAGSLAAKVLADTQPLVDKLRGH